MKVVLLTAGAAGMFCGSCMHDNALARSLRDRGVDCVLQPVYTPIRTDAESIADQHVFFGGIHIYLLQQMPWLRHVPAVFRRVLDWPPLIRWATRRAASTDASKLGELSVSMLKGTQGRQADEVLRMVDWLRNEMKPDAIVLSNLLIGGALPEIRRRMPGIKIAVILQGDDIFLDHLPEPSRGQTIELCKGLVKDVDHFIVNSRFYGNKMGQLLDLPNDKLTISPLSIDLQPFAEDKSPAKPAGEFRLGYLARIAPEKGLHHLVEAFIRLASEPKNSHLTLHVAGWLGSHNHQYFRSLTQEIESAGLTDRFTHHGSPDLEQKISLLRSLELLCVPTDYEEPKGLFVLEALAAGVPVIEPDHGAFGELLDSTGGGLLVPPGDTAALCESIQRLIDDAEQRRQLGETGRMNVAQKHSIDGAAEQLHALLSAPA